MMNENSIQEEYTIGRGPLCFAVVLFLTRRLPPQLTQRQLLPLPGKYLHFLAGGRGAPNHTTVKTLGILPFSSSMQCNNMQNIEIS
jgi:hypothetical protein